MKISMHRVCTLTLIALLSFFAFAAQAAAQATPTTMTLAVTSAGAPVTSVASGSVVTLTATVKSGSAAVTVGQVNFCDASATYCTDIHLLGTAQLTSAGTASLSFVPGIGSQSYKAVFAATPNGATAYAGSSSSAVALSVTGTYPTTTAIAASGSVGDYSLTATVSGDAPVLAALAGTVSFLDTTNSNSVLGTAALGTETAVLSFSNSSNPATNPFPQSVAVADFNGDGKLDLVVPVYSIFTPLSDMNLLLGNGDGTFTAGPAFPLTGQNVNNAAVGDFNGDGNADVAISLPDANEIQVLLGSGDGSFTPMPAISVNGVFVVATGDFNGDGKPDLVTVNPGPGTLTILLGNGDGTFTEGATITTPANGPGGVAVAPASVVVGDFNGDGIPDLAVANTPRFDQGALGSATILLGNGDGTFTAEAESPAAGGQPLFITAGDFNGDGKLDLAVSDMNHGYPELGTLTVLLGNGDGTFTPTAVSPQTGSIPYSVAIGDFNGDGNADLVTADAGSNIVTVLLGNGDGTFAAPLSSAAGTDPIFGAVGDFNGDGTPDLAVANNTTSSVTVLLGHETQTATATATGISPVGTGTHLVDASYPGDSNFSASISSTVGLTAVPPPSFTLSGTAVSVAPGATTGNTSTITVTPSGGFTGSVALTAAITFMPTGAKDLPTLSFGSTSPVIITGNAGTATLTISTTAATSGALAYPARPGVRWYAAGGTTLAFVLLFGIGIPVRGRSKRTRLGLLVFLAILAGGLLACGGGGGISNPGTTPGTYTVTVTGTSGSTTATGAVTLTVQ